MEGQSVSSVLVEVAEQQVFTVHGGQQVHAQERTLNRSSTFAASEDIMTGPRTPSLHPCLRRPWLLLPFLATVVFLPMACSDQPTETTLPS